jgi:integrase
MSRTLNRLKDVKVRSRTLAPGHYADGGGLYLQVSPSGSKSWVFRYQRHSQRREIGLGAVHAVSLAAAREKAAAFRTQLADGRDPFDERRAAVAAERGSLTFREAAEAYIAAHAPAWRNAKHAAQWRNTLSTHAYPVLGELPVQAIDTTHVLKVLEPIWRAKTETAKRIRGRIESILDWATARRYRSGENPARWRGHLDKLLARPTKVHRVQHFAALPYADVPSFMADLRRQSGTAARALEFCILTATRTGETIGIRWLEVAGEVWTVPGQRTKSGRDHRVPLAEPAATILDGMRAFAAAEDAFVFPGGKPGKPLSNMAMAAVLKRMGRTGVTVHGFRSAFRDWCRERTNHPREVAEAALAHVLRDRTEAAYARGDVLDKRARLMAEWAQFCANAGVTA